MRSEFEPEKFEYSSRFSFNQKDIIMLVLCIVRTVLAVRFVQTNILLASLGGLLMLASTVWAIIDEVKQAAQKYSCNDETDSEQATSYELD